jgi:hypothetical protein
MHVDHDDYSACAMCLTDRQSGSLLLVVISTRKHIRRSRSCDVGMLSVNLVTEELLLHAFTC